MHDQPMAQMPRYRCHKEVWALKIERLAPADENIGMMVLYPENKAYAPMLLSAEWADKHKPEAGGYWVQYKDGYTSYSPADAFEEGYSPIVAISGVSYVRAAAVQAVVDHQNAEAAPKSIDLTSLL